MVVEINMNYSPSKKSSSRQRDQSNRCDLSAPSKLAKVSNCNQMVVKIDEPFRSGLIYLTIW